MPGYGQEWNRRLAVRLPDVTAAAPVRAARATPEPGAAPTPSRHREAPRVRTALRVSSPSDPAEREAVATARRVVAMPQPEPVGKLKLRTGPQAALAPVIPVPRPQAPAGAAPPPPAAGRPDAPPEVEAEIKAERGGGRALPGDVQTFMAPRFKADFSGVRIHTDPKAAKLATRLGARAFTFGRDIFFNSGEFRPETPAGMELIAHELTHTIQQKEVVQREAAEAVHEPVKVLETSQPQAQRGLVSEALDWIADHANHIPGFRLFTIILGINPINQARVERSGANILRALVEFLPGGGLIVEALERYGIFERAGGFIDEQFRTLGMVGSMFRDALMHFLDSLGISDLFSPGSVWNRARRIFTEPVDRLLSFGRSLVTGVLRFIRHAILRPLAALAQNTRGYDLLKAVLGQDPVTGEAVPRNADTLIGGFMKLIGQEEIWENIKKANAIPRAWAWFQNALSGLMGLVRSIPTRFMDTLRSLEIMDLVLPYRAFTRVGSAFASFVGDFLGWGLGTVLSLLEILFEVVAPRAVPYIRRAAGAFRTIIRNPIGFVRTLVAAGQLGFRQFGRNFLTHLQASLIGWLTGAMAGAGVYIPTGFSLGEIVKFVLSVLGLTWANIRTKLVAATNETVVRALETGFEIVRTLVTQGPAAAWQQIVEGITNLRDMVIEQIKQYVQSRIVQAAVTRLLSMLSPAGAFIQAIIATYNTIMFFVERLNQIAQVAASFIDSISAIAAGTIAPAANRVERTMAGLLTLVISFLARIAGLGGVADAVKRVIDRVRAPIDRALDRVVAWIVAQARRLGRFVAQAGVPHDPNERLRLGMRAARTLVGGRRGTVLSEAVITTLLAGVKVRYGFTELVGVRRDNRWWVRGRINPEALEPVANADGVPAGRLGELLEPILAAAEVEFLRRYQETRELDQMARDMGVTREARPEDVPRDPNVDDVQFLHRVRSGEEGVTRGYSLHLPSSRQGFSAGFGRASGPVPPRISEAVTLSAVQVRAGIYSNYVAMGERYDREGNPTLATLGQGERVILNVERARYPGMLPAMDVAQDIARRDPSQTRAAVLGRLAPMAAPSSGQAAEQDLGLAQYSRRQQPAINRARATRRERIGNIFIEARRVVAGQGEVPGDRLAPMVQAFNAWLRSHLNPDLANPERGRQATASFISALVQFLTALRRPG